MCLLQHFVYLPIIKYEFCQISTVLYETIHFICNMFGSVLECYELTGVSLPWRRRAMPCTAQLGGPLLKASSPG